MSSLITRYPISPGDVHVLKMSPFFLEIDCEINPVLDGIIETGNNASRESSTDNSVSFDEVDGTALACVVMVGAVVHNVEMVSVITEDVDGSSVFFM